MFPGGPSQRRIIELPTLSPPPPALPQTLVGACSRKLGSFYLVTLEICPFNSSKSEDYKVPPRCAPSPGNQAPSGAPKTALFGSMAWRTPAGPRTCTIQQPFLMPKANYCSNSSRVSQCSKSLVRCNIFLEQESQASRLL